MQQQFTAARAAAAFDQDRALVVVVEMSQSSWLATGLLPGVERQPLKKLEPDPECSHKGAAINKTIRKRGARRFFLPQYSPDLNPIEQVFAKLKTLLCKSELQTAEGARKTIGALLSTLSADECAAYLRNSDYA